MLSRTAESLYWASAYTERADNTARKLGVGYRMSLIPAYTAGMDGEWESLLSSSGLLGLYQSLYDSPNQRDVVYFFVLDSRNPSSIKNCINRARDNGRAVRTAITTEVWYALNQSYHRFKLKEQAYVAGDQPEIDLPVLCDWVNRQSAILRGAFINTQMQNDGSDFFNLGYFMERADNTARLLDIKYYVLLPNQGRFASSAENYQWSSLLRALSSYRSFDWAYSESYSPYNIADFLILNKACPRSLRYCVLQIVRHLDRLSENHGRSSAALHEAQAILQKLDNSPAEKIISDGLHEFLVQFTLDINRLGESITDSYLFKEH